MRFWSLTVAKDNCILILTAFAMTPMAGLQLTRHLCSS